MYVTPVTPTVTPRSPFTNIGNLGLELASDCVVSGSWYLVSFGKVAKFTCFLGGCLSKPVQSFWFTWGRSTMPG